jgi:mevalonate kinase
MDLLKIKKPVEIVLCNSGLTALTKEVVGDVKKLKDAQPEKINAIFNEYEKLEEEAKKALQKYDLKKVGELMNQNHSLLQQLTVSCKELDEIVTTARNAGAFGAKLTGTGRGGLAIVLTPGKELQEKVAKAIEAKGYETVKTVIG